MARSFTLSCWLLVGISAVLIALKHCLPAAAVEAAGQGIGGVRGGPNRGEEGAVSISKSEMLKMMSSVVYAQKSDTHKWVTSKLKKETAILKYLYRAGDKVVAREVLLDEVWGYNAGVATHTLETHIYRLRQKIEENSSEAKLLVSETGGYRLVP